MRTILLSCAPGWSYIGFPQGEYAMQDAQIKRHNMCGRVANSFRKLIWILVTERQLWAILDNLVVDYGCRRGISGAVIAERPWVGEGRRLCVVQWDTSISILPVVPLWLFNTSSENGHRNTWIRISTAERWGTRRTLFIEVTCSSKIVIVAKHE